MELEFEGCERSEKDVVCEGCNVGLRVIGRHPIYSSRSHNVTNQDLAGGICPVCNTWIKVDLATLKTSTK